MTKYSIFLIFVFLIGCAHFDRHEKIVLSAMYVTSAIDLYQTMRIVDDPDYFETNPLIGQDKEKAAMVIASHVIVAHVIAYCIPKKYRHTFLGFCFGYELKNVVHNYRIGVR